MIGEPRWLSDEEQKLWRMILATGRKIDRSLEDVLTASAGLSMPEYGVLVALSEAEDHSLRMKELCAALDWDRSRMSHQITRMERRGFLTKQRSQADARGVVVTLTEEGTQRLEKAVPDHVESVRQLVFDHLDRDNFEPLRRFMEGILDAESPLDSSS